MAPPKKWSEFTPKEKKRAKINIICISFCVVMFVLLFILTNTTEKPSVEEKKEIVSNSEWDGSVKQVEEYLKNTLNDPKSYDPVEWGTVVRNPDVGWFIVRHKYRAKNVFGGVITMHQIFTLDSLGVVISVSDIQ